MKKVLLSLSAIALFAVATSCNSGTKSTESKDSTKADTTAATTSETSESTASADVPTFSDDAVTKYCQDYAKLVEEYTAAIKAKDATKMTDLSKKASDLGQQGATLAGKLKPEEAKKFSDFLTAQSKAMTDAATQAAK